MCFKVWRRLVRESNLNNPTMSLLARFSERDSLIRTASRRQGIRGPSSGPFVAISGSRITRLIEVISDNHSQVLMSSGFDVVDHRAIPVTMQLLACEVKPICAVIAFERNRL